MESLENQTFKDFETLVVPDSQDTMASMENHLHSWRRYDANVALLPPPPHVGASAARNAAAGRARGDLLGFLDDDVVLDTDWCRLAVMTLIDASVGGVSGRAEVQAGPFSVTHVPRALAWVVGGSYWKTDRVSSVLGAAGMNFCINREVFLGVGGYDEALGPRGDRHTYSWLRLGAEESDLALRIVIFAGMKVLFNPSMVVWHRLRRDSLMPSGLIKRSMHVGHNRAYIHARYPKRGQWNDSRVVRDLGAIITSTPSVALRHPGFVWKRLAFSCTVIVSFGLGYLLGILQFRTKRDHKNRRWSAHSSKSALICSVSGKR